MTSRDSLHREHGMASQSNTSDNREAEHVSLACVSYLLHVLLIEGCGTALWGSLRFALSAASASRLTTATAAAAARHA